MSLDYRYIGQRIREERIRAGLSQTLLADFTDSSPQYISHIENGRKKASLEIIVRISNVLRISVDRLLLGDVSNCQSVWDEELKELLYDCSIRDRKIILDVVSRLKKSLQANGKQ